jgi:hypothetical protein
MTSLIAAIIPRRGNVGGTTPGHPQALFGAVDPEDVRSLPLIGWYLRLVASAAQPRDPAAVERTGWRRDLYGPNVPGEGWGALQWLWTAALCGACAVLVTVLAGAWWLSLLFLPLVGYAAARTLGTFRERYY